MPTTDDRLRREREAAEIQADIRRGLRDLAANAMRVAAGDGKPEEVLTRVTWLSGAIEAYREITGLHPRPNVVVEALSKEFDHDLWHRSTELQQRHAAAMDLVEAGALRLTAARIVGQPVQSSRALSTLRDGIHALATLRQEAEARYAQERRAAAQAEAAKRPSPRLPANMKRTPARQKAAKPAGSKT